MKEEWANKTGKELGFKEGDKFIVTGRIRKPAYLNQVGDELILIGSTDTVCLDFINQRSGEQVCEEPACLIPVERIDQTASQEVRTVENFKVSRKIEYTLEIKGSTFVLPENEYYELLSLMEDV